jgi:hypothetical protein
MLAPYRSAWRRRRSDRGCLSVARGRGYDGWFVLEQDTALAAQPGPGEAGRGADVRHSIEFLDALIGSDESGGSPIP